MIHGLFLVVGVFMIGWGVVGCALLITMSLKAGRAIWLVTVPAVLVIAFLAQIASGVRWVLRVAAIPLLLLKLYELWARRRSQAANSLSGDRSRSGPVNKKAGGCCLSLCRLAPEL